MSKFKFKFKFKFIITNEASFIPEVEDNTVIFLKHPGGVSLYLYGENGSYPNEEYLTDIFNTIKNKFSEPVKTEQPVNIVDKALLLKGVGFSEEFIKDLL